MLRARLNNGLQILGLDAENIERLKKGEPILVSLAQTGGTDDVAIMYGDYVTQRGIIMTFWEKHFSDHWEIGPVLIYGENAMHWAVNIKMGGGLLCFRLPLRCYGQWWPLYIYWSVDGTPQSSTWIFPESYR